MDFGCGSGTYTIPAAKIVGEQGKVYALDKDKKALDELMQKAESASLRNIERLDTLGELKIELTDESVDVILLFDVFHSYYLPQADDRRRLLNKIYRIMKHSAFISVWPKHMESEAKDEIESASFYLESEYSGTLIHDNKDLERAQVLNFRIKVMIQAVCFDLGDTLVAEESVIHNSFGQAITAEVVEGVVEVLETIRKGGYKIALIANGDSTGARNVITSCGLADYFDAIVISEEYGIEKPAREIFQAALDRLGVEAENAIMVGNRIDADIVGASRMGMKSVWFKWNNRYQETISNEEERPDFIIKSLSELFGILSLM